MNTFSSLGFGAIISFLGQEEDMLPKVSNRARDLPSFKVQKSGEGWGFPLLLRETQGTGAFEVLETQCPHQVLSLPFSPNLLFYSSFEEPVVAVKVTPVHFVTCNPGNQHGPRAVVPCAVLKVITEPAGQREP